MSIHIYLVCAIVIVSSEKVNVRTIDAPSIKNVGIPNETVQEYLWQCMYKKTEMRVALINKISE